MQHLSDNYTLLSGSRVWLARLAAVMATMVRIGQSLLLCPQNVDEFACDDFVIAALTILVVLILIV